MKPISLIFKNDLKRRAKSPFSILVLLIIPFVLTTLIGSIFGQNDEENKLPSIKVLLADNDKNLISKFLTGSFDTSQMKDMFQVTIVEEPAGQKLISKGKASALVIIPKNFTEDILSVKKTQIRVIKNPSEQFLPNIVEEYLNTVAVLLSGAVQVFEPEVKEIKALMDTPFEKIPMAGASPFMEKIQEKFKILQKYLSPLLLELQQETIGKKEAKKKPSFNIFSAILPMISIMFLMFIIEVFMREILTEREDGKLKRIMFAPVRPMDYIVARIISGWIFGIMVYAIVVVAGILFFKIKWGNYFYLAILVAVTCFWIASLFALMYAFFKNKNQAGAFISPIILAFSVFGGSMMPIEQMPHAFKYIANFTLNYWFIQGTGHIGRYVFPSTAVLSMAVTGIILFSAAAHALNKRITV